MYRQRWEGKKGARSPGGGAINMPSSVSLLPGDKGADSLRRAFPRQPFHVRGVEPLP